MKAHLLFKPVLLVKIVSDWKLPIKQVLVILKVNVHNKNY